MANVSDDSSPIANCGELSVSSGDNGVGKLMVSKTTIGARPLMLGIAEAYGCALVSSESLVGPDTKSLGTENTDTCR